MSAGVTRRWSKPRPGALLVGGGISILLVRAAAVIATARRVLRGWVIGLAGVELALDVATLLASLRWWATNDERNGRLPRRLAAAATVVHAGRVLVFVLGRLPTSKDFDVRPEQRATHDERWSWPQVWFAALMSVLGIIGVLVAGRRRSTR